MTCEQPRSPFLLPCLYRNKHYDLSFRNCRCTLELLCIEEGACRIKIKNLSIEGGACRIKIKNLYLEGGACRIKIKMEGHARSRSRRRNMPDQDQESLYDQESRRHRRFFSLKTVLFQQFSPLFLQ